MATRVTRPSDNNNHSSISNIKKKTSPGFCLGPLEQSPKTFEKNLMGQLSHESEV